MIYRALFVGSEITGILCKEGNEYSFLGDTLSGWPIWVCSENAGIYDEVNSVELSFDVLIDTLSRQPKVREIPSDRVIEMILERSV